MTTLEAVYDERIVEGSRVLVWDFRLYKNDRETPDCYRPATVVKRYGRLKKVKLCFETGQPDWILGPYPDCVDVIFDHRPDEVSEGHFTNCVKLIEETTYENSH